MKPPQRKRITRRSGWPGRLRGALHGLLRHAPGRVLTACLLLPGLAWAAPIDLPQLQQLDRGARQDLDSLQRSKTTLAPDQDPGKANTAATITPHERRQQLDQFTAQEANRREALRRQYRNKFDNRPAPMQRLDRIHQHRSYQLQQQRQLRQFRSERGLPPRTLR